VEAYRPQIIEQMNRKAIAPPLRNEVKVLTGFKAAIQLLTSDPYQLIFTAFQCQKKCTQAAQKILSERSINCAEKSLSDLSRLSIWSL
jgi:hypothetical protein